VNWDPLHRSAAQAMGWENIHEFAGGLYGDPPDWLLREVTGSPEWTAGSAVEFDLRDVGPILARYHMELDFYVPSNTWLVRKPLKEGSGLCGADASLVTAVLKLVVTLSEAGELKEGQ
jgi:hypothetical protein